MSVWSVVRRRTNLHADESDLELHNARVVSVISGDGTGNGGNKLADPHTERTVDQKRSSTESLNGPERDRGGADVDEGGDERDQERVGDGVQVLEEDGSEVEDAAILVIAHVATQDRLTS